MARSMQNCSIQVILAKMLRKLRGKLWAPGNKDLNGQKHAELQHPGHIGQDAKGVRGQAVGPRKHEDLNGPKHAEL